MVGTSSSYDLASEPTDERAPHDADSDYRPREVDPQIVALRDLMRIARNRHDSANECSTKDERPSRRWLAHLRTTDAAHDGRVEAASNERYAHPHRKCG